MALGRVGDPADSGCVVVRARDGEGALVAVLHLVPWGHDGLSLDLMRRSPDCDSGGIELAMAELMTSAKTFGVSRVSMNFAVFRSVFERAARLGAGPSPPTVACTATAPAQASQPIRRLTAYPFPLHTRERRACRTASAVIRNKLERRTSYKPVWSAQSHRWSNVASATTPRQSEGHRPPPPRTNPGWAMWPRSTSQRAGESPSRTLGIRAQDPVTMSQERANRRSGKQVL
jgi:hypothetical protein